jgi:hypothetical protein
MRIVVPLVLLLAACSGQASRKDQLQEAANQPTPEAAQVLNGAAENGLDANQAINEAAAAQASNASTNAPSREQARPNSAAHPNPPRAGEPPEKVSVNSL